MNTDQKVRESKGGIKYAPEVSRSDMDRVIGKLADGGRTQLKRLDGLSKHMDAGEVYRVDVDRMVSKMIDEGKDLLDGLERLERDMDYYEVWVAERASGRAVDAGAARPPAVVYGAESVEPADGDGGDGSVRVIDGLDSKLADLWNAASGMLDVLDDMRAQR